MSRDVAGREVLPYGSWGTPVTSAVVIESAVGFCEVRVDGEDVIWSEGRPGEGGRIQLVRRSGDGATTDLLPVGQNARTAVHAYGGGAWWARDGVVWFVAWDDQRLYRLDLKSGTADALTPEPALHRGDRYADGDLSLDGEWIVCVREHHPPEGPSRSTSATRLFGWPRTGRRSRGTGGGPGLCNEPAVEPGWGPAVFGLVGSPEHALGRHELRVRELLSGGEALAAGGPDESVSEPCWQADGSLTFISDRDGWWNLYRWSPDDESFSRWSRSTPTSECRSGCWDCPATRCWPMVEWYSPAGEAGSTGSRSACQMALSPTRAAVLGDLERARRG